MLQVRNCVDKKKGDLQVVCISLLGTFSPDSLTNTDTAMLVPFLDDPCDPPRNKQSLNIGMRVQLKDIANTSTLTSFRIFNQSIDRVMIKNIKSCLVMQPRLK